MAHIDLSSYEPVNGVTNDGNPIAAAFQVLQALLNGSLDATNLAAGLIPTAIPAGSIFDFVSPTAPPGWLTCDGSAVSRSTYSTLFAAITRNVGAPTISLASPAVITMASHGLVVGDAVFFETTGALPTGITADTTYYVISAGYGSGAFEISATPGGSAINTSVSQSGTHTLYYAPFGVAASASTFNLPDLRGRMTAGFAASGGHTDVSSLNKNDGVAAANRRPTHKTTGAFTSSVNAVALSGAQNGVVINSTPAGTSSDVPDAPAYLVLNKIIKT